MGMSSTWRSWWKFVGGIIAGAMIMTIWYAVRPQPWTDSAESITRGCAQRGLGTEFTVADGRVSSWECVAP